jgi:hypothetical protein
MRENKCFKKRIIKKTKISFINKNNKYNKNKIIVEYITTFFFFAFLRKVYESTFVGSVAAVVVAAAAAALLLFADNFSSDHLLKSIVSKFVHLTISFGFTDTPSDVDDGSKALFCIRVNKSNVLHRIRAIDVFLISFNCSSEKRVFKSPPFS